MVHVKNTNGKSDPVEVFICAAGPPQILEVHRGTVNPSGETVVRPGGPLSLRGCGFLGENQVWFGSQAATEQLSPTDGNILRVNVPASLSSGMYKVYVTNPNGKSNLVTVVIE